MKNQFNFIALLALLCSIPQVTSTHNSSSTQTLLNAFNNPFISEQDLINFLAVANVAINATNSQGQTFLMLAAQCGYEDLMSALLQTNLNVNIQDNKGRTALMFAAYQGSTTNVNNLLSAGAHTKIKDQQEYKALDYAAGNATYSPANLQLSKASSPEQMQAAYIQLIIAQAQQAQGQKAIIPILKNHKP